MVEIEAAGTDLVDAVTDLWVNLAAGQRDHGSHILPEANRTRIRETVVRHAVDETLLIARADRLIGFIIFERESGALEQDIVRGVVSNLYVLPERRGEGIGSKLLTAAEQILRERDVDVVALEVLADNEAARQFYKKAGYRPHRIELEKPVESDTHSKGDG